MDAMRPVRAFDRFQQSHAALALPLAVLRKFLDDKGMNLVSLIAYRTFVSVFPLLMVMTTLLGFVLAGDRELREKAVDSVLTQFPVIGEQIQVSSLEGSGLALTIGLAISLWAGFGVILATQQALDRIWAVPHRERHNFLVARLRALGLLALFGTLFLSSTVVSGLIGGGALGTAWGLAVSLGLNAMIFGSLFGLLTSESVGLRDIVAGTLLAAVVWAGLQLVGGYYVSNQIRNAAPAYGTFALVIGLLAWIHVGGLVTLLSAELNSVLSRRLWPRSLIGIERPEDERVARGLARAQAMDDDQRIRVEFDN